MDQKEFEKFIIFIAFANSAKHPLAELKNEFYKICEIISEFAASTNHPIFLQHNSEISIEGLSKNITRYLRLLYLFHFPGHPIIHCN